MKLIKENYLWAPVPLHLRFHELCIMDIFSVIQLYKGREPFVHFKELSKCQLMQRFIFFEAGTPNENRPAGNPPPGMRHRIRSKDAFCVCHGDKHLCGPQGISADIWPHLSFSPPPILNEFELNQMLFRCLDNGLLLWSWKSKSHVKGSICITQSNAVILSI